MIDGQHAVLTRTDPGAILEVTSTVALRAIPSASPDAGHGNRRSQITIRALLLDTLLVDRSRDATLADQAIDSDRRSRHGRSAAALLVLMTVDEAAPLLRTTRRASALSASQGSTRALILRHTFCAHLAMKGAPARAIQELAGHAF